MTEPARKAAERMEATRPMAYMRPIFHQEATHG
jgi:hypothetical protein